jgi:hypothetical protein
MIQLTEGRWSPTVKQMALTTAGFLPVSFVLFLILFFGRRVLYSWVDTPVPIKAVWLNVPFMSLRIGLGVLLLYGVALVFARAVIAEHHAGGDSPAALARRTRLGAALLMLYVVVLSLWCLPLLLSIDQTSHGAFLCGDSAVTEIYTGFGLVTFLVIRANARGVSRVSPASIQDIAKLTFAMCIFWMYFFYSQYLVIWYGNVPVETKFFLRRFFVEPWKTLAFAIFLVGALIPFAYLLKRLTGRPPTRHKVFIVILFMGWIAIFFERIMLVFPTMSKSNALPIGPVEILITAGFFSLFVLSRDWFVGLYRPALDLPR